MRSMINPQPHITHNTNTQLTPHTNTHNTNNNHTTPRTNHNHNNTTHTHHDNNPQNTTRAGTPMPSAAHQRRGGVRHAA